VQAAGALDQPLTTHPGLAGSLRRFAARALVLVMVGLALWYVGWRCAVSVNLSYWWFALPLLGAEVYSCVDTLLFGLTVWRAHERPPAPKAPAGLTVDVLITRYDEPVELLRRTVRAARAISYPHRTYVLDDGDSETVRAMAAAEGVGYVVRGDEWRGRPRHAKAGNLSNALMRTDGEFVLVLDADQVPRAEILDRVLGYFDDPKVAFVQTPQYFSNVPPSDPLGCQAPLFYGPIQQGKDGWNAAFYCGSNAVLRRDALLNLGVVTYVRMLTGGIRSVLRAADRVLTRAARRARAAGDERAAGALDELRHAVAAAELARRRGDPIQEFTYAFQRQADEVSRRLVAEDLSQITADLATFPEVVGDLEADVRPDDGDQRALRLLASREWSPLGAIEAVRALVRAFDVDLAHEAQPVLPLSTISVTEDMATSLALHALGWRSVFASETLAAGLAPEDLASAFRQRLRWAQGTIQVLLRQNPLTLSGLSAGQRLMYLATMWSYLSGFASVVYFAGPPLYLLFGVMPIAAYSADYFAHALPYLLVCQALFCVAGWRMSTWRGQQYSLTLFPLWIRATWGAIANVALGRALEFRVTPKVAQSGVSLTLVWPQLAAIGALSLSVVVGIGRLLWEPSPNRVAILANIFWACYLLAMLSVVAGAVRHRPPGCRRDTAAEQRGDVEKAAAQP